MVASTRQLRCTLAVLNRIELPPTQRTALKSAQSQLSVWAVGALSIEHGSIRGEWAGECFIRRSLHSVNCINTHSLGTLPACIMQLQLYYAGTVDTVHLYIMYNTNQPITRLHSAQHTYSCTLHKPYIKLRSTHCTVVWHQTVLLVGFFAGNLGERC